ncbi:MAG: hypothetical protein ACLSHC_16495 [Bilophila wadsworthia]
MACPPMPFFDYSGLRPSWALVFVSLGVASTLPYFDQYPHAHRRSTCSR